MSPWEILIFIVDLRTPKRGSVTQIWEHCHFSRDICNKKSCWGWKYHICNKKVVNIFLSIFLETSRAINQDQKYSNVKNKVRNMHLSCCLIKLAPMHLKYCSIGDSFHLLVVCSGKHWFNFPKKMFHLTCQSKIQNNLIF